MSRLEARPDPHLVLIVDHLLFAFCGLVPLRLPPCGYLPASPVPQLALICLPPHGAIVRSPVGSEIPQKGVAVGVFRRESRQKDAVDGVLGVLRGCARFLERDIVELCTTDEKGSSWSRVLRPQSLDCVFKRGRQVRVGCFSAVGARVSSHGKQDALRCPDLQLEIPLPADDDVGPVGQRSELGGNPFPALPAHDDGIPVLLRSFALGHAREVRHLLREPPWQGRIAADRVGWRRGDNERQGELRRGSPVSMRPCERFLNGSQASSGRA